MNKCFFVLLLIFTVLSCGNDDKVESEIAKLPLDVSIERFDLAFANASPQDLPKLKQAFPFMFSSKYEDDFWVAQMQDTLQQEIQTETQKAFKSFTNETQDIVSLFKHLKYYFPEFNTPRVVTVASNVDYRNKVVVTDTIVVLPLANYLGDTHYFYQGIQDYIRKNLKAEQMVVDLAESYAKGFMFQQQRKTLLDELIYAGKQLYFKDMVIPFKTDAEKIGYSQEQIDWAKANEENIWRYFVDKELLFSTNSKLPSRFINDAPFSKFYLEEIDNESPGRIGQYIGWQIVRAYMENNNVTFKQMLTKSTKEIFDNAKFKPRR
ncbi:gliding motility lipoprotein GldB [Lacinutrix sp. 5H-3-7-4]|uniref:gliding motility lipoprotein GldB n=1 Tax=Lacinutrix sp. (strain 5H-3-7-4) TaxID=983544 RepID=UPI00020A36E7|nr:gliding motility lipoprotein GldB [Lacinutrix sp. 5H-3-7-4]AEH00288.1 gliding motility-associated lipoprotein GldB [Lacinutrix sp. 5H-3-7-4]